MILFIILLQFFRRLPERLNYESRPTAGLAGVSLKAVESQSASKWAVFA